MKYFIFDTETTGLDANRHSIIQLGYIRLDGDRRSTTLLSMRPFDNSDINLAALEVNRIPLFTLFDGISAKAAYDRLKMELDEWINKFDKHDKFIPVGYNVRFDVDFLRAWFLKVDPIGGKYFGSYFASVSIDVWSLIPLYLKEETLQLPDTKLSTVAAACGLSVKESETHNALADALLTEQLFNLLKGEVK